MADGKRSNFRKPSNRAMEIGKEITIDYLSRQVPYTALNAKEFVLEGNVYTKWTNNGKKYFITAEKGFTWDGATIPRFTWSALGYYPGGLMMPSSLWHDLIYHAKGLIYNVETSQIEFISRKHCDQLFYKHMIHCGVRKRKAKYMYQVIRLFGRFYWADFSDWIPFKRKKE